MRDREYKVRARCHSHPRRKANMKAIEDEKESISKK